MRRWAAVFDGETLDVDPETADVAPRDQKTEEHQVRGGGLEPGFGSENTRKITAAIGREGHQQARIVPLGGQFFAARTHGPEAGAPMPRLLHSREQRPQRSTSGQRVGGSFRVDPC